ncbi:SusD/RagB family nutrient-binding outer membrane lipoprotein [Adhaeribacter soli]|uniref:SusD/RagB family nutrient-binding outer membrane lipoprotein n=1 Tax=Adhaeribacter soli TaxID=2607655 RepID=A0A5N1J4I8_9BACT|nr:SusD/RagB family nutrient-binding outer membrane lipoprotein [Adhaeribacter soli]KAA9340784.1 SusD/RagB family nutrient-binding outer membrane lipoprotein [Adhaeribacter soli]
MKRINKYLVACIFASMFGLSSCEKDFLDVNTDPNNPLESTPELTLSTGIGYTAYTMGNQFQILGNFWSQHWTQSYGAGQFRDLDSYRIQSNTYDRPWQYLYSGALNDFKYVSEQSAKVDRPNHAAIADIMMAYVYQVLVDGYDQVPFSEALQGSNNLNPKYDAGKDIYAALIPMIDGGVNKITEGSLPEGGDLVYQGDMDMWRKFANTLKLKIYLRQAYVSENQSAVQTGVAALLTKNEFIETGEDAEVPFVDQSLNRNPIYQTETTTFSAANIVASNTILNYLNTNNDTRIGAFFKRAASAPNAGNFAGLDQGITGTGVKSSLLASSFSKPSSAVAGPTAPVPFISAAESYFLQAEAELRYGSFANAQARYEDGVNASFAYNNVSRTGVTIPALSSSETLEENLEKIITQKWVAMSGRQGFEAWTELRRTGYPSFIKPSASSVLGSTLMPNRLLFSSSESLRNSNTPAIIDIHERVWWDRKN